MLKILLITWTAGGLLPLGARFWWGFEIFSHFRLQYLAIALPLLVLALARGQLVLGALLAATMALNAWPLLPDLPRGSDAPAGPGLVLLNINVEGRNAEHERVLARIRESGADAVQGRRDVLAQQRLVGAGAREGDVADRGEEPGVRADQGLHDGA